MWQPVLWLRFPSSRFQRHASVCFVARSLLQDIGKQSSVEYEKPEARTQLPFGEKYLDPRRVFSSAFYSARVRVCVCLIERRQPGTPWCTHTHFQHCSAGASRLNTETMCLHPNAALLLRWKLPFTVVSFHTQRLRCWFYLKAIKHYWPTYTMSQYWVLSDSKFHFLEK